MATATMRPDDRRCKKCGEWKHHSRFHSWVRKTKGVARHVEQRTFSPTCLACDQKGKDEEKNLDRAKSIIEQRAGRAARAAGATKEFFLTEMGWSTLVPIMRAMMSSEGRCNNCCRGFVNERDIQIEHIEPPTHPQDLALLHARNIRLYCASCNKKKGKKSHLQWCREEEDARVSNRAQPSSVARSLEPPPAPPEQGDLFKF